MIRSLITASFAVLAFSLPLAATATDTAPDAGATALSAVNAAPAAAAAVADPDGADALAMLFAQENPPRRGDCARVCETRHVNCQRGCFALAEREAQDACSRRCLSEFEACSRYCSSGLAMTEQAALCAG